MLDRSEAAERSPESTAQTGQARSLRSEVCERVSFKIDLEAKILAPALRSADGWGQVRANELLDHHVRGRALLDVLRRDAVRSAGVESWRRGITLLRAHLRHEQEDFLGEDLLRDDVVGISVEAG